MKLTHADAPHLLKIEDAIDNALRPFKNPGTESALAALACIRIAKALLEPYPEHERRALLEPMMSYLAGAPVMPADQASDGAPLLWTPPNHFGKLGQN